MGYKIGLPSIKLNNVGFTSKNCGSFAKVTAEALQERKGLDMDIDPTKAALNEYEGFATAKELIEYSEQHIDEINAWRAAHGEKPTDRRALRSDTVVMCTIIIKPPAELMEQLSPPQQKQLLKDSADFIKNVVGADNVKSVAYHFDELVPHAHIFWEPNAGDHRLCAKEMHNTKNYFRPINKGLPEYLRSKGWTMIDDCNAYDAAKEQELREEMGADEYAKHRAAEKAKRGRDSKTFKHQADKAVKEATAKANAEAERRQREEQLAMQARQQREADELAAADAKAELERMQEQALAYDPGKKHLTETQAAYNDRIATAQQAAAVLQRTAEQDTRQRSLDEQQHKLDAMERNIDAIATKKAKDMAAKPIADAQKETAAVKADLTAERTAHHQTQTALRKAIKKIRDMCFTVFVPYAARQHSNAHEQQVQDLIRGNTDADLARRRGDQPKTTQKSQSPEIRTS